MFWSTCIYTIMDFLYKQMVINQYTAKGLIKRLSTKFSYNKISIEKAWEFIPYPAGTWRRNDVALTSIRRNDVS